MFKVILVLITALFITQASAADATTVKHQLIGNFLVELHPETGRVSVDIPVNATFGSYSSCVAAQSELVGHAIKIFSTANGHKEMTNTYGDIRTYDHTVCVPYI